jgi:hypothetical protein
MERVVIMQSGPVAGRIRCVLPSGVVSMRVEGSAEQVLKAF